MFSGSPLTSAQHQRAGLDTRLLECLISTKSSLCMAIPVHAASCDSHGSHFTGLVPRHVTRWADHRYWRRGRDTPFLECICQGQSGDESRSGRSESLFAHQVTRLEEQASNCSIADRANYTWRVVKACMLCILYRRIEFDRYAWTTVSASCRALTTSRLPDILKNDVLHSSASNLPLTT